MNLIERLRDTPNWQRQDFKTWKDGCSVYDRAPFEAADEIERLRRELAEYQSVTDAGAEHRKVVRLERELAEAKRLLSLAGQELLIGMADPTATVYPEIYAFLTTADQPDAVKPCADCGEPTDVWYDGTHLCWKCRA